jgi:hypothetical protein
VPGNRCSDLDRCDRTQGIQRGGNARPAAGRSRREPQVARRVVTLARIFSISESWMARWS